MKNELGWYILKTFSHNVMDKLSFEEICKRVNNGKVSFKSEQIKEKLEELMSPSFNIIYYNSNSEKYAFSTPFWHRFLRLQFSIEKSEQSRKKRNLHNPNLNLISKDVKYQLVDESMFELIRSLSELRMEIIKK